MVGKVMARGARLALGLLAPGLLALVVLAGAAGTAENGKAAGMVISEAEARAITRQVAEANFGGLGIGHTALLYDQAAVRFVAPPEAGAHRQGAWYVGIPERRNDIEPSGVFIIVDAATGAWEIPRRE
jgi:hypothetical protein